MTLRQISVAAGLTGPAAAALLALSPQSASAQDRVSMPDAAFAEAYADRAFGTSIEDQAIVA